MIESENQVDGLSVLRSWAEWIDMTKRNVDKLRSQGVVISAETILDIADNYRVIMNRFYTGCEDIKGDQR